MGLLRDFRHGVDALERIAAGLNGAVRASHENAPSTERLDEMERRQGMWEAEVEAALMKAEGKLKAAANSEARERTMKKSREDLFDGLDPDSEEVRGPVPAGHVEASETEGMHVMHVDVPPFNSKAHALRAKFL